MISTDKMKKGVRAILVEDDHGLRDALVSTLSQLGVETIGTSKAAEFYQQLLIQSFDLAIIDLGLPDSDGLSIVRFLADRNDLGLIILSAAGADEDRIRGFTSGADLYFVKPVNCQELAAAATRLAQRRFSAKATEAPESWVVHRKEWRLTAPTGTVIALTSKEMEFLSCLGARSGEAVSRAELLGWLRSNPDVTDTRSLDALIRRLRLKADPLLGCPLPVRTVHGVGYLFSEPLLVE